MGNVLQDFCILNSLKKLGSVDFKVSSFWKTETLFPHIFSGLTPLKTSVTCVLLTLLKLFHSSFFSLCIIFILCFILTASTFYFEENLQYVTIVCLIPDIVVISRSYICIFSYLFISTELFEYIGYSFKVI